MRLATISAVLIACLAALASQGLAAENLIEDPSFELTKPADQFGFVFQKWGGWKYEGDCEFRVGEVARSGKTSALLVGINQPKIRLRAPEQELEPGRYRVTAWIRGLDIGTGVWNQTTEFMFDEKYVPLAKSGTFGWTPLTYVVDIPEKKKVTGPSFGLWATGYFWVDDVSLEKVDESVALTEGPILGAEEAPIAAPAPLGAKTVRCGNCGYRNDPDGGRCYACGGVLALIAAGNPTTPAVRVITSFEEGREGFSTGEEVSEHATDGKAALRLDGGYTSLDTRMDWTGFDYIYADLYADGEAPIDLYVEIRDDKTTGYWTRVNYNTIVPPGASTVIVPVNIYVGEKSRPGRMLDKANVTRLVFSIAQEPPAPLYIDNVRLVRDDSAGKVLFDDLYAFDLGTETSPLMEGFTRFTPATLYSPGRGYGLEDARVWKAYDALQPEPLYEDFLCIESGGISIDVPNGTYRVFMNIDSPSGFWGEYQKYRERIVKAEGTVVVRDTMDFEAFNRKYYRFWNVEDLPTDNTFDKYQTAYYDEKEFEVEVADGQLNLEFQGENWAMSLSALVVYPAGKAAEGRAFLDYAREKRRFHFDNYFKRILHNPTNPDFKPSDVDAGRGYVFFARNYMRDVYYNDRPDPAEITSKVTGAAFAGEYEPLTFSVLPLSDLGESSVTISDLTSPSGVIPSSAVDVGFVSYRLSRVTMEGSVYTIAPRLIMPRVAVAMPEGMTRRFWLTVKVPAESAPGLYKGAVTLAFSAGASARIPVEFEVLPGTLDTADIPAGSWGHTINTEWYGSDPEARRHNDEMARKSLERLREYGFTSFSGLPIVYYRGFKDGKPVLDFSVGDAQMKRAREAGFGMPVTNYCPFGGLNLYYQDTAAMAAAGFEDYSAFVKAIFSEIQKHADENNWLPVYWNLGDEPVGDNLTRSAENARAYTAAFPEGPPYFTAATSFRGDDPEEPHFKLASALHVANVNGHDEAAINLLHRAGRDWAFYNGGNRWTYGVYMYKAVKEFDMKFRFSWHWNVVAGDPYYALDCREDDYAWCNTSPDGTLIPSLQFERLREGLDDYRMLLTLARLVEENKASAEAATATALIAERMGAFRLGQRDHDALFGVEDWKALRRRVAEAVSSLRQ
ncbi:MAG: hypothetical protein ACYTAN_05215 [Planctomycetota bacterium]|jgi:hypothetical protein